MFGLRESVIRGREAMKQVVGFSFLACPNQALSAAHCCQLVPSAGRGLRELLIKIRGAEVGNGQAADIFDSGKGVVVMDSNL